jgi:hypothetical protein
LATWVLSPPDLVGCIRVVGQRKPEADPYQLLVSRFGEIGFGVMVASIKITGRKLQAGFALVSMKLSG